MDFLLRAFAVLPAGGGYANVGNRCVLEKMPEIAEGIAAVEDQQADVRMGFEQAGEVVGDLITEISVGGAFPHGGGKYIPKGDVILPQQGILGIVCVFKGFATGGEEKRPEAVGGVGIIPPALKRLRSRQRAENEDAGILVDMGRETLQMCLDHGDTSQSVDALMVAQTEGKSKGKGQSSAADVHL